MNIFRKGDKGPWGKRNVVLQKVAGENLKDVSCRENGKKETYTWHQKETFEMQTIQNEEKMEELTLTGHIEEKKDKEKQQITNLTNLCNRDWERDRETTYYVIDCFF